MTARRAKVRDEPAADPSVDGLQFDTAKVGEFARRYGTREYRKDRMAAGPPRVDLLDGSHDPQTSPG